MFCLESQLNVEMRCSLCCYVNCEDVSRSININQSFIYYPSQCTEFLCTEFLSCQTDKDFLPTMTRIIFSLRSHSFRCRFRFFGKHTEQKSRHTRSCSVINERNSLSRNAKQPSRNYLLQEKEQRSAFCPFRKKNKLNFYLRTPRLTTNFRWTIKFPDNGVSTCVQQCLCTDVRPFRFVPRKQPERPG